MKFHAKYTHLTLLFCSSGSTLLILTSYIPYSINVFLSYLQLFFPIASVLVLITLIASALLNKKIILGISSIGFLASFPFLPSAYQQNTPNDPSSNQIEVVTYNLSFFNIPPALSEDYFKAQKTNAEKPILNDLTSLKADIICLQEYYTDSNNNYFNFTKNILNHTDHAYYHYLSKHKHNNGTSRGIMTFTRYPIVKKGKIFLNENAFNGAQFTDVAVLGDTIRVINTHMQSTRINISNRSGLQKMKHVLRKFKYASAVRNEQIEKILIHVKQSPHPVILCGDFNETPYSNNIWKVRDVLSDSFMKKGNGFGNTFNKGGLPLRIDNIFFDEKAFKTEYYKTITKTNKSEHFPVKAAFSFRKK